MTAYTVILVNVYAGASAGSTEDVFDADTTGSGGARHRRVGAGRPALHLPAAPHPRPALGAQVRRSWRRVRCRRQEDSMGTCVPCQFEIVPPMAADVVSIRESWSIPGFLLSVKPRSRMIYTLPSRAWTLRSRENRSVAQSIGSGSTQSVRG